MMDNLKASLIVELRRIEGVEHRLAPVSGGSALFYNDVPFAHFHHDHELDLRLGKKHIKALGLAHPAESIYHPKRAPTSAWIELRFNTEDDVAKLVKLVRVALGLRHPVSAETGNEDSR